MRISPAGERHAAEKVGALHEAEVVHVELRREQIALHAEDPVLSEAAELAGERMLSTRSGRQAVPEESQGVPGCSTCANTRGSKAVSRPTLADPTVPVILTAPRTGTNGCW